MTLGGYSVVLAVTAILGWGSVLAIVLTTKASAAGRVEIVLLYLGLGLALAACFGLLGLAFRRGRARPVEALATLVLRQGFFAALAVMGLLMLQVARAISPVTAGAVVSGIIILEALFLWPPRKRN
ncbi:hypothetical protein HYW67_01825 [Candidatus Parcubacteria bacterium]|nr:hypothetical protein [Candidatus Parcubacteria bacterium]